MKALTLMQPWASLVLGTAPVYACGKAPRVKDIENRKWDTDFRGDLLVHAGQHFYKPAMNMYWGRPEHPEFPQGALLGVVRLVDVFPPTKRVHSPWAEQGMWHWKLTFPRPFLTPITWRGQQKLFEVSSREVEAAVEEAELVARREWYSLPEDKRIDLVERAAIKEDSGIPRAAANMQSIQGQ